MKKIIAVIIGIVVLLTAGVYIFIGSQLNVSKVVFATCSVRGANRILSDKSQWPRWWPDSSQQKQAAAPYQNITYSYQGDTYTITNLLFNTVLINIGHQEDTINSILSLVSITPDSVAIEWKWSVSTGLNPLRRIRQYNRAVELKEKMSAILSSLQTFLSGKERLYGMNIEETISKDSTLLATRFSSAGYPTVTDIYSAINKLKDYISQQGASATNYPMLHVKKTTDSTFEATIAIPTNKQLSGNASFYFVRFVPWKVLGGTVRGGNATVNEALKQLQLYTEDHRRTIMAIPFQSLITDRSLERDTSQWVTTIYVPVS